VLAITMSSTKQIYVAVVDDDENVCRSYGRLLRAADIQPVTYSSAEAFLDIQLGGMSGIQLSQQLLAEGGTTPVIFITAQDDPEARAEAEAAGCAAYFRKTDSGAEVLDTIRRLAA
jgi:FixJ family two-component response regulator